MRRIGGPWLGFQPLAWAAGTFCLLACAGPVRAAPIGWVRVPNPGNACKVEFQGCFGSVPYDYWISTFEVTNAQYVEFLNAVARTDPNGLYNPFMADNYLGGITRSGEDNAYVYALQPGFANAPVNYVSFYDALRFANWMHNGQPSGFQDATTTEDGAYTITPAGVAANSIVRNPGAQIFLTSEDEWYKAAYYDPGTGGYFDYPAGANAQTTCALPGAAANTANCDFAVGGVSEVGAYAGSASPVGTFDQGGNVEEWNEAVVIGTQRGRRGGAVNALPIVLAAAVRDGHGPASEFGVLGFRVATIPEPAAGPLGPMMVAVLGWARRRVRGAARG